MGFGSGSVRVPFSINEGANKWGSGPGSVFRGGGEIFGVGSGKSGQVGARCTYGIKEVFKEH